MKILIITFILLAAAFFIYRYFYHSRNKEEERRINFENALKFLYNRAETGRPMSMEGLQRGLHLSDSALTGIVGKLKDKGLITLEEKDLVLSDLGKDAALQIIRAHRLWERYLADETNLSMERIHEEAERKEHELDSDKLEALNAHLGYPQYDPHGDPIPGPGGQMPKSETTGLTSWPENTPARIQHLEDEPVHVFRKLYRLGFRPGKEVIKLGETESGYRVEMRGKVIELDYLEASNVFVIAGQAGGQADGEWPLSTLRRHETGEVIRIEEACQGLNRRRFLDLGITPGTLVKNILPNAFGGDPTAYFVRGTKIALRKDQAEFIIVKKVDKESELYG